MGDNSVVLQAKSPQGFHIVQYGPYRATKGIDTPWTTPAHKVSPLFVVKSFGAGSERVANRVGSRARNSLCLQGFPLSLQAAKWRLMREGWGSPSSPLRRSSLRGRSMGKSTRRSSMRGNHPLLGHQGRIAMISASSLRILHRLGSVKDSGGNRATGGLPPSEPKDAGLESNKQGLSCLRL